MHITPALRGLIALALLSVSGCATMMSSGPDHVSVASNPVGATVFLNDTEVGQTPMVVALDRAAPKATFRFEFPGFTPVEVTREKTTNGWVFGNIFLGGLIGVIIDAANNNATKFDDEPISVDLEGKRLSGAVAHPDLVACKRERLRQLQEARKISDQRERMQAMRAVPSCS